MVFAENYKSQCSNKIGSTTILMETLNIEKDLLQKKQHPKHNSINHLRRINQLLLFYNNLTSTRFTLSKQ